MEFIDNMQKFVKNSFGISLILLSLSWLFILPFIPLNSDKSLSENFFTQNRGQYMLLFFGFPGCHTICPPTLKKMGELYQVYQQNTTDNLLDITFINLLLTVDKQTAIDYAKQFEQHFITYQPTEAQLAELTRQLGVYSYQTQAQTLEHSGYIYLLENVENQWIIRHIYPNNQRLNARFFDDLGRIIKK